MSQKNVDNSVRRAKTIFIFSILIGILLIVIGFIRSSGNVFFDNKKQTASTAETTDMPNTYLVSYSTTSSPTAKQTFSNVTASSSSTISFTNLYGTSTTLCAHSGCTNYIASSGDTNCCVLHSRKCLNCGKYIDEDALYCISCLAEAASSYSATQKPTSTPKQSYSNSSKSSFTNQFGTPTTKCAHPGCSNYIASSGDTNCCTIHSKRCANCGKYIDEDAFYCIACIKKAIGK